jgi:AcrR family transcriptional regulator
MLRSAPMAERGKYDRTLSATQRKREQRRTLLLAATSVFAKQGFAGACVEDIVREAGMSRRTFYEHFDDLADALAGVHEASGKIAVRWVEEALSSEGDPSRKLERGIRALLELISENTGLARVLFGDMRIAGPKFDARQEKLRAHFGGLLKSTLIEAHARGDLPRAPDDVSITAIVAAIEAVGAKMASPKGPDLDEATEAMVRLARGACL